MLCFLEISYYSLVKTSLIEAKCPEEPLELFTTTSKLLTLISRFARPCFEYVSYIHILDTSWKGGSWKGGVLKWWSLERVESTDFSLINSSDLTDFL